MSDELKPGGIIKPQRVMGPDPGEYAVPLKSSEKIHISLGSATPETISDALRKAAMRETPAPNRHQLTDLRRVARQTRALTALAVILIVFFGFLNMVVK